jgi:hypothetical protein
METTIVRVRGRGPASAWDLEVVDDDDIGERVVRTSRPYEYEELVATRRLVAANALVIDVGANIETPRVSWRLDGLSLGLVA